MTMDADEKLNFSHPDPDNVTCRSCKLAIHGVNKFSGEPYYCKTNCGHYINDNDKPYGILMNGDTCEHKVDGIPSVDQKDVIDFV